MISLGVLLFGISGFLATFIIHVLIWRVLRPAKKFIWLVVILILFPALIYFILIIQSIDIVFIAILHFLLSVAYIATYPAIRPLSPSLKIILAVSNSMSEGMTSESIANIFCVDTLLSEPFSYLVNDGLIFLKDGKWVASAKGRLLYTFFAAYRRLIGLPVGEG